MHYALSRQQGHPSPAPQCSAAHCSAQSTAHNAKHDANHNALQHTAANCAVSISTGNCITQTTLSFSHRTVEETAAPAGWYKVQSAERERGRESGSWEQQQQLQVAPAFCLFLLLHSPTTTRPLLQALAPTQPMAHFYNPDLRLYLQKFLKFWALIIISIPSNKYIHYAVKTHIDYEGFYMACCILCTWLECLKRSKSFDLFFIRYFKFLALSCHQAKIQKCI